MLTHDEILELFRKLNTALKKRKIKSLKAAFEIVEQYYPKSKIPPKTQFVLEEIFEG